MEENDEEMTIINLSEKEEEDTSLIEDNCPDCKNAILSFITLNKNIPDKIKNIAILCMTCGKIWKEEEVEDFEVK